MQVVNPIASVSATRNETLARQHFISQGVLYRSQELVKNSGSMVGLMEKSPRLMSIPTVAETLDVSRSENRVCCAQVVLSNDWTLTSTVRTTAPKIYSADDCCGPFMPLMALPPHTFVTSWSNV